MVAFLVQDQAERSSDPSIYRATINHTIVLNLKYKLKDV